jgi:aconitate hydratase
MRSALREGDVLASVEAAGASVRDPGDPRAGAPLAEGSWACGDEPEVAAGRARATSIAALGAHRGVPLRPASLDVPGAGLADTEVIVDGATGVVIERGALHVPPATSAPLTGSPRGVVLHAAPGDVACDDVLARGPRARHARGDAAALAMLSARWPDAERAGRARPEVFNLVAALGRYGEGAYHDAASRATRALGIRAVLARSFAPAHARALAIQGVLPLAWSDPEHAIAVREGDELELTGVAESIARDGSVPVRSLTAGVAFAARIALDETWTGVALAGGLLATLAPAAED